MLDFPAHDERDLRFCADFLFLFYFHIIAYRSLLENLNTIIMRKKSSIDDSYFCRGMAIYIRDKHLRCVKLQSMYSEICHVLYPLFMWNSAYCKNNDAAGLIKPTASGYVRICNVMIFPILHQPNMKINCIKLAALQLKRV